MLLAHSSPFQRYRYARLLREKESKYVILCRVLLSLTSKTNYVVFTSLANYTSLTKTMLWNTKTMSEGNSKRR